MLISNSLSLFEINYFNGCVSVIIFIIIIIIIIITTIKLNNSLLELILAIFC